MNNVCEIGRMTKDPELKYIEGSGTAVTNFTMAVDRNGQKDKEGKKIADFLPIVVFGKQAENVVNFCHKGSQISFIGSAQSRNYENKDGIKIYVVEFIANRIGFLDPKPKDGQGNNNQNNNQGNNNNNNSNQGNNNNNNNQSNNNNNNSNQGSNNNNSYQGNNNNNNNSNRNQNGNQNNSSQDFGSNNDITPIDDGDIPF